MWKWKIFLNQTSCWFTWSKIHVWEPLTLSKRWVRAPCSMSPPRKILWSGAFFKILNQKRWSYKYVLPLRNWIDWATTRQEIKVTTSKMYILGKNTQKLKGHILPLWLSSEFPLNPIQDGLFQGCSRMGVAKKPPSLKSFTDILQWVNLAQLYIT